VFDRPLLASIGDQDGVAVLNDEQVAHPQRRDQLVRVADDDAVLRVDARVVGEQRVAVRVGGG
jgi:hypothetical protein